MRRRISRAAAGLLVFATACGSGTRPVRIGSHDFTEQKLLAEMMALLAENEGVPVERAIPYGDNRQNLAAVQRGVLDAYPEYDATLLALAGAPMHAAPSGMSDAVRTLVEPIGLTWLEPFGLDDGFVVAVRRDMAIRKGLRTISDLTRLEGPLRVGADRGYVARPVDGLHPLARRYGLVLGTVESFDVRDRDAVFDALSDHRVDVVVVFGTDSRLEDYVVATLEDDLGFFSDYRPAPLARASTLAAHPVLDRAWGRLGGRVGTDDMRRLTSAVERTGQEPEAVARGYLEDEGLLPRVGTDGDKRRSLTLAVSPMSNRGYFPMRAAHAIRAVMPGRRLRIQTSSTPALDVQEGDVRFGLVGAEEMFMPDGLRPLPGIEAVGVVGTRLAHIVVSTDTEPRSWSRVAVGPEYSSSERVARVILGAADLLEQVAFLEADQPGDVRQMLLRGDVDAVIQMVAPGHAGMLRLLDSPRTRLASLPSAVDQALYLSHPYLRPAKLPANTYPGQPEALDTLAAQAVLATRVPPRSSLMGSAGPGLVSGVFTRLPQRLPFPTALRVSDALGAPELVDPLLPTSPGLRPKTPPASKRLVFRPLPALLNGLAIAFLVAMLLLVLKPLPPSPSPAPPTSSAGPENEDPTPS